MKRQKTLLLFILAALLTLPVVAQELEPVTTDTTIPRLDKLEKRTGELETRLGRPLQTPTAMNSVERRLQNLEKKIATLERDLDQLDSRVKRLEAKR
jgi:predicted  nucleic acid-binding Zn-ribbon protein